MLDAALTGVLALGSATEASIRPSSLWLIQFDQKVSIFPPDPIFRSAAAALDTMEGAETSLLQIL